VFDWLKPIWIIGCSTLALATAAADVVDLRPTETDLTVQVLLAGDGTPVVADRVVIRAQSALMAVVAEAPDVDGEVTFPRVPVILPRSYIVSAWVDGVGYHVRHSGQAFAAGEPAIVHAFESTDRTDGLTITGMNLVVRQRDRGFGFEAIVTVDNQSRPQRTVRADALPVQLALPEGLEQIVVEVDDGPEPFAATLQPASDLLTGVVVGIPPGQARITVKGIVPADAEVSFSAASSLPVDAWSLLVWPGDLSVDGDGLRRDDERDYGGYGRWSGDALAPGQSLAIRVWQPRPAEATTVFADPAEEAGPVDRRPRAVRTGVPWLTITAAVVLLGAYLIWRQRR